MASLTGAEVCDEYIWLVSNGMSVPVACETLGKKLPAMEKLLQRNGFTDYLAGIYKEVSYERRLAGERKKISA